MPQMSPIMWTTILISSTMIILQMNSYLYFELNTKTLEKKKKKKKKKTENDN